MKSMRLLHPCAIHSMLAEATLASPNYHARLAPCEPHRCSSADSAGVQGVRYWSPQGHVHEASVHAREAASAARDL